MLLKHPSHKSKQRIRSLLLLKSGKFETQQQLANYLGITRRCLSGWLRLYRNTSIEEFLPKQKRNRKSKIITPQIHKGLEEKLKDKSNPY